MSTPASRPEHPLAAQTSLTEPRLGDARGPTHLATLGVALTLALMAVMAPIATADDDVGSSAPEPGDVAPAEAAYAPEGSRVFMQWNLDQMGVWALWQHHDPQASRPGEAPRVAVLAGTPGYHEALRDPVATRSWLDDDASRPHATTNATQLIATDQENAEVAGICPDCEILLADITDREPVAAEAGDIAEAVHWSVDEGADVIAFTESADSGSEELDAALDRAAAEGLVMVAPSAKPETQPATPQPPADHDDVIGVRQLPADENRGAFHGTGQWHPDTALAVAGCPALAPAEERNATHYKTRAPACSNAEAIGSVAGVAGLLLTTQEQPDGPAVADALRESPQREGMPHLDALAAYNALHDADLPREPGDIAVGDLERYAGAERTATAAAIAQGTHDQADTALLARSDDYADALSAGPLASALDAPLLLTDSTSLGEAARGALDALDVDEVVLMGGTTALDDSVERDLERHGYATSRIAGDNRYATARAAADRLREETEVTGAVLAQGAHSDPSRGWPDAVLASQLGAFKEWPVLLAGEDHMPQDTQEAAADLAEEITEARIVGGQAAISPSQQQALTRGPWEDLAWARAAGADRQYTAQAVAEEAVERGADPGTVWLATADDWADALAAGPAAAREGGVLLTAQSVGERRTVDERANEPLVSWVREHDPSRVRVSGGPAAVSPLTTVELDRAASGEHPAVR